jgi:hypothetical protein
MLMEKIAVQDKIGENHMALIILKGVVWKEGVGKNGDITGI